MYSLVCACIRLSPTSFESKPIPIEKQLSSFQSYHIPTAIPLFPRRAPFLLQSILFTPNRFRNALSCNQTSPLASLTQHQTQSSIADSVPRLNQRPNLHSFSIPINLLR